MSRTIDTDSGSRGKPLDVRLLGHISYDDALSLQHDLVERRQQDRIPDTLLLLEHAPIITTGRSTPSEDVPISAQRLESLGIDLRPTERGGKATYHGPGQLVGYIIANLYEHHRSLKKFVYRLEEVFMRLLADYRLCAVRDQHHHGVWIAPDGVDTDSDLDPDAAREISKKLEKILAIGIAVKSRVTYHGFAFNVAPNLDHFDLIVPCGIADRRHTTLSALIGRAVSLDEVIPKVVALFSDVFGYRCRVAE